MELERKHLLEIYTAAIDSVAGDVVVKEYLQQLGSLQEYYVIAVGKVADVMMQGALDALQEKLLKGLVISKPENFSGTLLENPLIDCVAGGHPIPTTDSLLAGKKLIQFIKAIPDNAYCLVLISGGTSSLVEVLQEGVLLSDLQSTTDYLLASGYGIREINSVRKGLSEIKGGGLWKYLRSRKVQCLMISDVQGDDPSVIGSGLLFPDDKQKVPDNLPPFIADLLSRNKQQSLPESFSWKVIACLNDAKYAAKQKAEGLGYSVELIDEYLNDDAELMGKKLVRRLEQSTTDIVIWGGETVVQLPKNAGNGGRNQHLALSAAIEMSGKDNMWLLSMSTDGIDGNTIDAGALVDGRTVQRGELYGVSAEYCLQRANSNLLLEESGDLIFTGASRTNVADLLIGLKLL